MNNSSKIKFLLLTMLLTLFMAGCTGETSTTDTTMADVSTEATDTASVSPKKDATDQTDLSKQTDQTDQPNQSNSETQYAENKVTEAPPFDASDIPAYTGDNYAVIHDNVPYFDESETK